MLTQRLNATRINLMLEKANKHQSKSACHKNKHSLKKDTHFLFLGVCIKLMKHLLIVKVKLDSTFRTISFPLRALP